MGYAFHSIESGKEFGEDELIDTVRLKRAMDCVCLPRGRGDDRQ